MRRIVDRGDYARVSRAGCWISTEIWRGCSNEQIFDLDRQLAHTYAGGVMDGARDRRGHPRQSDLADPPGAKLVQLRVGVLDEIDFQRGYVGVCRDDVVGEIGIDRRAVSRIVRSLLEQAHADAHDHGAFDLVAPGERVEDAP